MKEILKKALLKWAETLSDEELKKAYYDAVYDSLGSESEEMYERGYEMVDIQEQERYEKYLIEKSNLLGTLCEKRGIKLWEQNEEG